MNEKDLSKANGQLAQETRPKKSIWVWIIIGLLAGLAIIALGFFIFFFVRLPFGSTYPYIPVPKRTPNSLSKWDILASIVMDMNDSEPAYAVFSRRKIVG